MTIFQAILLGVLQGVTEFLPISSSGHLVVLPALLGWQFDPEAAFVFDVWVQLGTLLAVIVYFWGDLWRIAKATLTLLWQPEQWSQTDARLGVYLAVATVPAVVAGLLFQDAIEAFFSNAHATAVFLLFTAVLLAFAEWMGKRSRELDSLIWLDALVMGCFQALALLPGVSRSGSTITGGMLRNLERGAAARFSFLMSVPVMLGAGVFTGAAFVNSPAFAGLMPQIGAGLLAAGGVGVPSIHWLLRFVTRRTVGGVSF